MPSPHHLPEQLTSFVGREEEIATVKRLLANSRMVTLTGTGGCGKTRLALRVARDLLGIHRDGIRFVDLSALANPDLVPQTVAAALGLKDAQNLDPIARLTKYLRELNPLLILDNCEHLAQDCASLASSLLRECHNLRILATSRQALGLASEMVWRVPSLTLPEVGVAPPVELLARYEAIRLFIERARLKRYEFELTPQNAGWIVRLCRRLDGIPLAIELAAARMNVLSVRQIVEHLDDRFRLLRGDDQVAPPRHQTLQAMMDWSYDLLAEAEKGVLRSMSVFAGGFTLEALEAMWTEELDEYEAIDHISQLVGKSLVVMEERSESARYRLLETIRQYAWQELVKSGEMSRLRNRHAEWCLRLAEESMPQLYGSNQRVWLERLEVEHDNLRAALDWCTKNRGNIEVGLRLGGALLRFWEAHGHFTEGRERLSILLSSAEAAGRTAGKARALNAAGRLAWRQADYATANKLLHVSLSIYREIGDKWGAAHALNNLGNEAFMEGRYNVARSLYDESLALFREINDSWGIGQLLHNLATVAATGENYPQASEIFRESLAIRRQIGDRYSIAQSLISLGEIARAVGDYASARPLYEESLAIFQELGDERNVAYSLHHLGHVSLYRNDLDEAETLFARSLRLFSKLSEKFGIAIGLAGMAGVVGVRVPEGVRAGIGEVAWEEARRAARLFGAADAHLEATGARLDPADLVEHNRSLESVRSRLDETEWKMAWLTGRSMSLEHAIEYALPADSKSNPEGVVPLSPAQSQPGILSEREIDVLRLVAAGLTNVEIGERLVLSPRTVQAHLRSIYGKLGISSRSAATRYAIEHKLA
jgi:non-specific serine/threonine protein kinase